MSSPVPEEAIDAAMEAWGVNGNKHQRDVVVTILKAAAPYFYAACGRADYGQHSLGDSDLSTLPMNDPRMGPPNPPNPTWSRPFG